MWFTVEYPEIRKNFELNLNKTYKLKEVANWQKREMNWRLFTKQTAKNQLFVWNSLVELKVSNITEKRVIFHLWKSYHIEYIMRSIYYSCSITVLVYGKREQKTPRNQKNVLTNGEQNANEIVTLFSRFFLYLLH